MQVILTVLGRKCVFSEEELTAILERHFSDKEAKATREVALPVTVRPTEGEWFRVNPATINREIFQESRENVREETTRLYILDAFSQLENNPGKYDRTFETLMPQKFWEWKTSEELKSLSAVLGHHMADWVEQALEWAQRIQNGETWEDICTSSDTAKWFRLVTWKDGHPRLIGGSTLRFPNGCQFASHVDDVYREPDEEIYWAVPLIVR